MTKKQATKKWVAFMASLLDGIERNLPSPAPRYSRMRLQEFRKKLNHPGSYRVRHTLEHDLDEFVESSPRLTAAANLHIADICTPILKVVDETTVTLKRLQKRCRSLPPDVR